MYILKKEFKIIFGGKYWNYSSRLKHQNLEQCVKYNKQFKNTKIQTIDFK